MKLLLYGWVLIIELLLEQTVLGLLALREVVARTYEVVRLRLVLDFKVENSHGLAVLLLFLLACHLRVKGRGDLGLEVELRVY